MLDVNNTLDLVKLKLYNEWLYTSHIYPEEDSEYHKTLTKNAIETYIEPLKLAKDSFIVDIGCGPGYFLDEMKARGYTNVLGITLSPEDIAVCKSKGHNVKAYDMSFLPQTDGFIEEAVDFVFCRQSLEHSPYPIFSLMEYNRILKQNGCIYIETPAPDCDRPHEYNKNHYSVLGANQLNALIQRTGFNIHNFNTTEYDLKFTDTAVEADSEKATQTFKEKAFCILASKARSIDIK